MKRRGQNLCRACYTNTLIFMLGCTKRVLRLVSFYGAICDHKYILKQSLATVTDAVETVNPKADREAFIRLNNTGTQRPVDRR